MKRAIKIITVLLIILVLVAAAYWYFFMRVPAGEVMVAPGNQAAQNGFSPLNRNVPAQTTSQNNATMPTASNSSSTTATSIAQLPILRELSSTPVGGFGINTGAATKSGKVGTTTVRWVDRGRGNIYEAYGNTVDINTISNTLVPEIYESWWNNALTSFVAQYLTGSNDTVTTVIANILKNSTAATSSLSNLSSKSKTASSTTVMAQPVQQTQQFSEAPYQLKGSLIGEDVTAIAVSPAKNKILVVTDDNDRSIGYVSNFDGSSQKQIFNIPLTQITVDWPETNTIAITTKASSNYSGYLYLVNVKTGAMKQILGNIPGLSAKVSRDAAKVIYSSTGQGNTAIDTAILDLKTGKATPVVFKTLADKCAWSAKFVNNVYCAAPSQIGTANYPNDWYLGNVSFNDNIWLLDTVTGSASQIADLLNLGNTFIDAYNLQIDSNDNYLVFMNKNDLSLWMLDLIL